MKLGAMKARCRALEAADAAFCHAGDLGWDAARRWRRLAAGPSSQDDLEALVEAVVAAARPGDHVLVMSNGGFGGVHDKLLARLRARTEPGAEPVR